MHCSMRQLEQLAAIGILGCTPALPRSQSQRYVCTSSCAQRKSERDPKSRSSSGSHRRRGTRRASLGETGRLAKRDRATKRRLYRYLRPIQLYHHTLTWTYEELQLDMSAVVAQHRATLAKTRPHTTRFIHI